MIRLFIPGVLSLFLILALAGCATRSPEPVPVIVKVPIPVPCKITLPEVPSWPLQEAGDIVVDLFTNVKLALAEIEARKGYEIRLVTASQGCNK